MVVVAPTLLVALYYALIASDQYESEAHFVVRSASSNGGSGGGLGQMLGLVGGISQAQNESLGVGDYLRSHDAVANVRRSMDLTSIFRRPEADWFSKLRPAVPTPEKLLKYYRGQVEINYQTDSGITSLKVRAFRPEDSYRLTQLLLNLGEKRVNALNVRAYESSVRLAQRQLADAEDAVARTQGSMTQFRQTGRDVDPQQSASAQLRVVSELRSQLALARAALASSGGMGPQAQVLAQRVQSLAQQVAAEDSRLAGGRSDIATGLGRYEELRVRQDFAAKRYAAAAAALETAREQATRQQLFVVRLVEPNVPVKSTYPHRLTIIGTVLLGLLLLYSVGWLILAGVREHAA
jgi:capsular polysaccharide transport system permease protein